MKNWTDQIKPEDLPKVLAEISQEIGVEHALTLAEKFGGGHIYLPQATSLIANAKRRFILDNPKKTVLELRRSTGYSDRQIIRIRNEQEEQKAASMQEPLPTIR